jgi:hypothetical protein
MLRHYLKSVPNTIDKKQITYSQVDNLLLALAKKYDVLEADDGEEQKDNELDLNISPEIVISETFIP